MEKKKKTQHLHYNNNWRALSSYKYMFYASYFFFLLVAFPCWCFTNTSLRRRLSRHQFRQCSMLSVKNVGKSACVSSVESSILNNFPSMPRQQGGCLDVSWSQICCSNIKLFFFFFHVLFSLLSGRAMMLRTAQLCVGCDLFPVMFSSFGM